MPGTPETKESIEPENPIEPEQVITSTMSTTATEQNTSNGKGEKCRTPKDFDGNEAKYKTWLRMTETYFRVNSSLFPDDAHKIDFALSYMNTGRAADWAEHFTDTHTKDGVLTLPEGTTWKKFVDLVNLTFDLRKTKDKVRVDLSILKHKPGKLKEYIMNFTALASRAGYILTGNKENPVLPHIFLENLNPQLRDKIETQKEPPEKLKDIISDARKFDKSYYKSQAWKTKVMGWQPNHSLPCQFP